MAADQYVDTARQNGLPARAHESSGCDLRLRTITFETLTADDINDIRRLFTVGAHEIPVRCDIVCDSISGASDIDLGLYRPGVGGVVVDADALMDGTNISGGLAWDSETNGLAALGLDERGVKSFFDIANDVLTTDVIGHLPNDSYDVVMVYNSEVAGAGTI
ncbi:unnamed protein product, partial [marine sediment metagenome]